jgi:acetylornithine deacetylase/succinyl-diaminopimelate desuccinylase-like protein
MSNASTSNPLHDSAIAWLSDLIAIPSPSGGEAAVAAYLATWATERGFELHTDAGNVMVRIPGADASRALLLHAHMDVVPAGDPARWETPPFEAAIRDGLARAGLRSGHGPVSVR